MTVLSQAPPGSWRTTAALSVLGSVAAPAVAQADGLAVPWQMGLQEAASPVMERISSLNGYLTVIMIAVVLLVMGLLAYVILRFNHKANPEPSKTTHHQILEVAWTAAPVIVLVAIAIPSFKLLHYMDRAQDAAMTIKATGHQWYWSYDYPDHAFTFDSFMKYPDDLEEGEPRLLAVDNQVVVPVGKTVRILTTSTDVIHSFAVPSLGLKTDANPGRINETWVRVEAPGTYYGQCSELCGVNHGFMPIAIRAVPPATFDQWVAEAREQFAATGTVPSVDAVLAARHDGARALAVAQLPDVEGGTAR
jgi:cytochrome c oxidase subunit 2